MASFPLFNFLAGGLAINFNTTTYFNCFNSASTTESQRKVKYRTAGVMTKLEVIISANTIATSATTVRTRLNGANGGMSVSIAAGATGSFTDATNSDTIAAGNDYNFQVVTPNTSGALTIRCANTVFTATSNTVGKLITRNAILGTGTMYFPLAGGNFFLTEAQAQVKVKTAGTFKNLYTNIVANTSSNSYTLRLRKNTADGNLNISVAAGTTGQFEDTSNTDTVAVDDLVALRSVENLGNITPGSLTAVEFETTTSTGITVQSDGSSVNANLTRYIGIGSDGTPDATEANTAGLAQVAGTYSFLACYVSANTVSAGSTLKFRKNSGNGNQSVSITASTTGLFEDTSNSDSVLSTDTIDTQLITGATGTSLTISSSIMRFQLANSSGRPFRVRDILYPQLDKKNPLAKGLVWNAVAHGGSLRELVGNSKGTLLTSGSWTGVSPLGKAVSSSSTTNGGVYYPWSRKLDSITTQVAVVVFCKPNAIIDFSHFWCLPYHNTWSSPFAALTFCVFSATTGNLNLQYSVGGTLHNHETTGTYVTAGMPLTCFGASLDGTNIRYFVNGKFVEQVAADVAGGTIDLGDKVEAVIMNRLDASTDEGISGITPFVAVWNRALRDSEMAQMSQNPFSLYARSYAKGKVPAAAGTVVSDFIMSGFIPFAR